MIAGKTSQCKCGVFISIIIDRFVFFVEISYTGILKEKGVLFYESRSNREETAQGSRKRIITWHSFDVSTAYSRYIFEDKELYPHRWDMG